MIFEEVVALSKPFDEAVAEVKAALAAEGFGTLTEIDMQATLAAKINKDIDPFVIIGACNPTIAARAIEIEPQIGALLPCNVVVRQVGERVLVEALDPNLMASITENEAMTPIAAQARTLINNALGRLTAPRALTEHG